LPSSEAEGPQPGIYLAHKPRGETSFSLVHGLMEAARLARIRKLPICHGGALDPFAEGLLLLLAGPATRLMEALHPVPKTYLARIEWGMETDNGDLLGRAVARGEASALTPALAAAALAPLLGWTDQVPPAFSNKRVEGERAYLKAHRGEEVVLPPSRVYLHAAEFVEHDLPSRSMLELTCRGGYYVRSLARDLGRALGCRAHLSALRRTAIGPWRDPEGGGALHLSGEALLPWLPSRLVTDREGKLIAMGKPIGPGPVQPPAWPLPEGFPGAPQVRALHRSKLVGLLGLDGATLLRLLKPV
jgi:tRNA pseudouridine55 synthase